MSNKIVTESFLEVEGVNTNPKYKKFNSGSILTSNGWINVAKNVDINTFEKGNTYTVDIEINEQGYQTIVKNKTVDEALEIPKDFLKHEAKKLSGQKTLKKSTDWEIKDENKNKSMMLGGLFHDASALIASDFSGTSLKEKLELVKEAVEGLIQIRKEFE